MATVRHRLPHSCAAAVAGLLLAAAPASATWGPPELISNAGGQANDVSVGMDSSSRAVIAWNFLDDTSSRIQARSRSLDGTLSPIQTLSDPSHPSSDVEVAVAGNGASVITWVRDFNAARRVQARTRSAAGVLGPILTLSASGAAGTSPAVGIDSDGDAVVVWTRANRIQARPISAAGTLGSTQNVSAATSNSTSPSVAVDSDGDAVLAWQWFDTAGSIYRVATRTRSSSGALGSIATISPAGRNSANAQVAITPNGDAALAWVSDDGSNYRAMMRSRTNFGLFSSTTTMSPAGADAGAVHVAVDPFGRALVVWSLNTSPGHVQVRARAANGTVSSTQSMSAAAADANSPNVAMDEGGNAVVTWLEIEMNPSVQFVLKARERFSGGIVGPTATLSPAGQTVISGDDVARSDGPALVAFDPFDGRYVPVAVSPGP